MPRKPKQPAGPLILNERTELVPIDSLQSHPQSVNQGDLGAVIGTVGELGFYGSVIVQSSTRRILAGRHRWLAAKDRGYPKIPATFVDVSDKVALKIMLADNRTCRLGLDDSSALADLLQQLSSDGGLGGTGFDDEALQQLMADLAQPFVAEIINEEQLPKISLIDRFGVPPFSVLDARQGYWQARKRAWLALGIQSELGRGDTIRKAGRQAGETLGASAKT